MANSVDFVVKHGLVVSDSAKINSNDQSTSSSTGALIVDGGVGIGKDLHVGGNIIIDGMLIERGTGANSSEYSQYFGYVTTVPLHRYGTSADIEGMIAFDSMYVYYCTSNYVDDSTNIWQRIKFDSTSW
jgi:hypothetical protein